MYRENKTKTNKFHIHQRLLRHIHQRKLRHLLLTMVMKSIKSNTDCVPAIPPGKTSKAKHKQIHCSGYICLITMLYSGYKCTNCLLH